MKYKRFFLGYGTKRIVYGVLALAAWAFCLLSSPVLASLPARPASPPADTQGAIAPDPLEASQALYAAGRYPEALMALQQALQTYQTQGDQLKQALTLGNLSLVYQQLSQWAEATQAIQQAQEQLQNLANGDRPSAILQAGAQIWDIQGRLALAQGQPEAALQSWQQASQAYQQAQDRLGVTQSQINQAQALRSLGLYRRAIALLQDEVQSLQQQPASLTQTVGLRSLGETLLAVGDLEQSHASLQQSLQVATVLQDSNAIAAALISLGNWTHTQAIVDLTLSNLTPSEAIAQRNHTPAPSLTPIERIIAHQHLQAAQAFYDQTETALGLYQQAIDQTAIATVELQAQLNQLNLLVETQQWEAAQGLWPQIQAQLDQLPSNHDRIYDRVNLVQTLMEVKPLHSEWISPEALAKNLAIAYQQAEQLGDQRAQSYALGTLATLYEHRQQNQAAQNLSQQALIKAQASHAADIAYRWQWQLGRLRQAASDREGAIAAYTEAVQTLQSLRNDLVAVNRDVQFSFRESVEPIYRQLADLLLQDQGTENTSLQHLAQARDVIEGLQVAELDNFFQEACLEAQFQLDRVVDQSDPTAAIFYTILLPDRLEVILKLPNQELVHYAVPVPQAEVEQSVDEMLIELRYPFASRRLQTLSQQMYNWLIQPIESVLAEQEIQTLVFVLDSALRNIPMAALYDGQHYLVEKYGVAIAPGLQLPNPQPLEQRNLQALIAGLSEARFDFPALQYVATEVEQIQTDLPSRVLLNQSFTKDNFQTQINAAPFSIVHIATHGQFSSNLANTFVLAWDEPIDVNELSNLLRSRELEYVEPIELLVLSACETAVGDRRAALGLAGIAVRAGARSTIASLWSLDDDSSAALMQAFYQSLIKVPNSRAEALRQAQLSLLKNPRYSAPRFWAPYVLLGNWL